MKDIKVMAFYLPQFHTIPENDQSYGKGFTEWTNVKKATPLFEGHIQPKVPLNNNYYNLLTPGVMKQQIEIAKQYGVYGFCYYHYWFAGGKKLLEKPLEAMLKDKTIDFPYCFCWANENWTRRWDGGNNEVIVEQDYGDMEDIINHVDYLIPFFEDKRYIKEKGRPLLLIYKPELIINCGRYIRKLRDECFKRNYNIKIGFQFPDAILFGDYQKYCDFYIEFEPTFVQKLNLKNKRNLFQNVFHDFYMSSWFDICRNKIKRKRKPGILQKFDYDEAWETILNHEVTSNKAVAGAFVDWDNTPRKSNGIVYIGATPKKFNYYFSKLIQKVSKEYGSSYIFVNAWNEWGEGAYLEPDENYGYGYLEAIQEAIKGNKE